MNPWIRFTIALCLVCAASSESPDKPHVIRIDPAMFRDADAVLEIEYGHRRITVTADQAMWILEDALFRYQAAQGGGTRKGKR